jgi:hypothetical protein
MEAPPVVETATSEDDDDLGLGEAAAQTPANPVSASLAIEPVDPFAAEGLLGDLTDTPLKTFELSSSKYEYNGSVMAPLKISTPQFGPQWGSMAATSPISIASSKKVGTLDSFMKECEASGLHPVESIRVTNEGICAGMVNGGSLLVLIHGKVSPLGNGAARLDVTVKSTDQTLASSLALYLQNMMN